MSDADKYKPSELLEILRKVWPEAYGHVVWHIRTLLKLRDEKLPPHETKGCSGQMPSQLDFSENGGNEDG